MKFSIKICVLLSMFNVSANAFGNDTCQETSTNTCQEEDYIALRALYLSTDGDNWSRNTGWPTATEFMANPTMPTDTEVDTWYGIDVSLDGCVDEICLNSYAGCVPSVVVAGNDLVGSIPPEIGNLTHLESLKLGGNELTNIPTEIENLTNLRTLSLLNNQLSGSIPIGLTNLSNLVFLSLGGNQFTGSIPPEIGNLDLVNLKLHRNQLTGAIPPEIGNLNNLGYIDLSDNQLTGSIPGTMAYLTNLKELSVHSNQLSGCYDINLSLLCSQLEDSYYYSFNTCCTK